MKKLFVCLFILMACLIGVSYAGSFICNDNGRCENSHRPHHSPRGTVDVPVNSAVLGIAGLGLLGVNSIRRRRNSLDK